MSELGGDLTEDVLEDFLDDVFDATSSSIQDGEDFDAGPWIARRPDAADAIHAMIELAHRVTPRPAECHPRFEGYEILHELGSGSMGRVFLARKPSLGGRLVALKVLPFEARFSRDRHARFVNEARTLARIRHPNIVVVYDVLETPHRVGYAMEYVAGTTLARRIAVRPASPKEVCRIGIQIACALDVVHENDLVHRDVKPSNILLREDGTALLADFGLVLDAHETMHTATGAFLGTLRYAAPEQLRGDAVDARTDVYGLAATLYEAVTGVPPIDGKAPAEIARHIEEGRVPALRRRDPTLPVDLEAVLAKALAVDPAHRYESARAFADDLDRVIDLRPVAARGAFAWHRVQLFVRRERTVVAAALLSIVAMVLVATGLLAWSVHRAERISRAHSDLRAARRTVLLDQLRVDTWIAVMASEPATRPLQRFGAADTALEKYRAALSEIDDPVAHLEMDMLRLAVEVTDAESQFAGTQDRDFETYPQTVRAAQEWHESGVASVVAEIDTMSSVDRRALGLLAYFVRSPEIALRCLSRGDAGEDESPLVDGLVGLARYWRGRYGAAYPRLVRSLEVFSDCGSLLALTGTTALRCDEIVAAERYLARAESAPTPASHSELQVLRGDLALCRGDVEGASACYRSVWNLYRPADWRLTELLERNGAWLDAANAYVWRVVNFPGDVAAIDGLLRASDAWWRQQDDAARRRWMEIGFSGRLVGEIESWFGFLHAIHVAAARRSSVAHAAATTDALSIVNVANRFAAGRLDARDAVELDDAARREWIAWLLDGKQSPPLDVDRHRDRDQPALTETPVFEVNERDDVMCIELFEHADSHTRAFVAIRDRITGEARVEIRDAVSGATLRVLRGSSPRSGFGVCMIRVPDLDGDGHAEVCISEPGVRFGELARVVVFDGRTFDEVRVFESNEGGDHFGYSLACLSGAQEPVLVIGAYRSSNVEPGAGRIDVFGLRTGVRRFTIDGSVAGAAFGLGIVGIGDLDGDGDEDFATAASHFNGPGVGSVHVMSGRDGRRLRRIDGGCRGFGVHLAAIEDQNGDGIRDLVIGETRDGAPDDQLGTKLHVVCPRTGAVHARFDAGPVFRLEAPADFDGDGKHEIACMLWRRRVPRDPLVRVFDCDGTRVGELAGARSLSVLRTGGAGLRLLAGFKTWTIDTLVEWGAELGRSYAHVDARTLFR